MTTHKQNTDVEATLRLALEALNEWRVEWSPDFYEEKYDSDEPEENTRRTLVKSAITAIKESLAQEQESAVEFWRGVYPDGWTAERVEAEMTDFKNLMSGMSELLCHITGGAISKPLTSKSVIKSVHDDYVTKLIEQAIDDYKETLAQPEQRNASEHVEPVAWLIVHKSTGERFLSTQPNNWDNMDWFKHPLYAAPPQPKEPEQKPVAWMAESKSGRMVRFTKSGEEADELNQYGWTLIPLYTTPYVAAPLPPVTESHKRKPLTDEQEPIGWTRKVFSYDREFRESQPQPLSPEWHPCFTTPPQRKPLTEEQIIEATEHIDESRNGYFVHITRAIEAAHGIRSDEL
jgi:hypothetical protein